ncbi:MAG TPA: RnfABCDGE type electron transport complex subunit D [Bacillota bacterium]|nr:RnfABCDGE type electron transport complex subunit D [Bacillota bacterium]
MNGKLVISSSPHIRTIESVQSVMIDVLAALFPVALIAVLLFGYQALLTMVIAVISAMLAEAIWMRKLDIFGDGSAAVTGLLLAMTLPPAPPWWLVVVGSFCAIIIGKQVFGGIGNNIFNPALVGRAILVVSWGGHMAGQIWPVPKPFVIFSDFFYDISAVTTATPLAGQEQALNTSLSQLLFGNVAGALGETSALALLVGAGWLFIKGHIDWRIPGGYIGTVFVMGAALGGGFYGNHLLTGLFHVLAGGVLLGALFMATDMVTSPVTNLGKLIFGIGCGVITMLIRLYGSFPEGVTFAILIMNALTPIIDNFTIPRKFGEVKKSA